MVITINDKPVLAFDLIDPYGVAMGVGGLAFDTICDDLAEMGGKYHIELRAYNHDSKKYTIMNRKTIGSAPLKLL